MVHCSAGVDFDGASVTAAIAPDVMQYGLDRLAARGINPDIVIPLALVLNTGPDGFFKAELDGVSVLRGPGIAIPDEQVLRDIFIGADKAIDIETNALRSMLLSASAAPVLNMREGIFAKRERTVWTTEAQRTWVQRILIAIAALTLMITLVTLSKYWIATKAENDRALAAAQKIDPSIQDTDFLFNIIKLNESMIDEGSLTSKLDRPTLKNYEYDWVVTMKTIVNEYYRNTISLYSNKDEVNSVLYTLKSEGTLDIFAYFEEKLGDEDIKKISNNEKEYFKKTFDDETLSSFLKIYYNSLVHYIILYFVGY